MAISITDTVRQGFKTAHQSWHAYFFYTICGLIFGLIAFSLVPLTGLPWEDLVAAQNQQQERRVQNLGKILDSVKNRAPQAGEEKQLTPEQQKVVDWFKKNWLLGVMVLLVWLAWEIYLTTGLIAYLIKKIRAQEVSLSDYRSDGKKFFFPVLLMRVMQLGFTLVFMIVSGAGVLLVVGLSKLGPVPGVIAGVLVFGLSLWLLVWFSFRVLFWNYIIPAENLFPVEALRRSFAVTKGRIGALFLFGLLFWLITAGVGFCGQIAAALCAFLFQFLGRGAVIVLAAAVGSAFQIYAKVVTLAASLHFYERIKAALSDSHSISHE